MLENQWFLRVRLVYTKLILLHIFLPALKMYVYFSASFLGKRDSASYMKYKLVFEKVSSYAASSCVWCFSAIMQRLLFLQLLKSFLTITLLTEMPLAHLFLRS